MFGRGGASLWMLPLNRQPSAAGDGRVKLDVGGGAWSTVARHAARAAFSRNVGGDPDIWRLRMPAVGKHPESPRRLIASTVDDFAQQYSPDGKRIAFESRRGGTLEIWTCGNEGENCAQLTSMGSPYTGVPAWSPDGREIAFYSRVDGKSQIFVVPTDGGRPRQLTSGEGDNFFARWSSDGQWIYYASGRSGPDQIWRIPSRGGTPVQMTHNGGFAASESPDARWLYYTRSRDEESSLWRMPTSGGDEVQVLPSVTYFNYTVVAEGIYYISKSPDGLAIRFFDVAVRATKTLAPVGAGYVGFSVSPDRQWILFTQRNPLGSDLFLVDNFR